ncbi:phosphoglycerate mutase-like protein [Coprinopsis marcescibilis]|uniref:Phosphoglycerate mutase-like protein n=1 Tax=Coprinopsis marcescibilis TaxID=230819 RepID=A0A5C3KHI3_COPMA|nr:phosphoglycerate mutase-like protein [Coprinopsis marcescibilis]
MEWCNMPHVTPETYQTPPDNFVLEYVEVIQRHHKRTPYSSNIFPKEDIEWNCDDAGVLSGLHVTDGSRNGVVIQRTSDLYDVNPFKVLHQQGFVGSNCQFPQLTKGGFEDSITHGQDLRAVYGPLLSLSSSPNTSEAQFRITNNPITSQVASGFFAGFYPAHDFAHQPLPIRIQPSSIDSLEPTYSCPRAGALRESFTTGENGSVWQEHLREAGVEGGVWDVLDAVSGIRRDDTGGWHVSFDHYFDNFAGKQCHDKPLPCNISDPSNCISQDTAAKVYLTGHWEYEYLYRKAPGAHEYSILKFGAWMLELKARLGDKIRGNTTIKYSHNIAHDGSLSSLLGLLQIEYMFWPGMGTEVSFELYRDTSFSSSGTSAWFIRILYNGQTMQTSSSLGMVDMLPIQRLFDYIDSTVGTGPDLYNRCFS